MKRIKQDLAAFLESKYRTIIDSDEFNMDEKVGYLTAVVEIDPHAVGLVHLPHSETMEWLRQSVLKAKTARAAGR
jgi:hypothetical protein